MSPHSAAAFVVRAGERFRIIDEAGGQPGDLVAFNANNLAERFSQSRTRGENRVYRITPGAHPVEQHSVPAGDVDGDGRFQRTSRSYFLMFWPIPQEEWR
jgi:uncharacterized protein YcgI (DUF1989 family)